MSRIWQTPLSPRKACSHWRIFALVCEQGRTAQSPSFSNVILLFSPLSRGQQRLGATFSHCHLKPFPLITDFQVLLLLHIISPTGQTSLNFSFFFFLLFVCLSIISFISLQWTLVTFPSSVAYMNITDVLLFYSRSSIKMRNKSRPDPASNSITSTAILGVFIPCSLFSQGEVLRYQIRDSDLISQVA